MAVGENPDKLEGWGQIKEYLGVTRKTILARGYPVHKYATGVVFAFVSELQRHEAPPRGNPPGGPGNTDGGLPGPTWIQGGLPSHGVGRFSLGCWTREGKEEEAS